MTYKGKFKPTHPEKYRGNVDTIRFLSSWELTLMKFFDNNSSILKWASEECAIPYQLGEKTKRYFPDFIIECKGIDGKNKIVMIEVKPYVQTIPPKVPKRKSKQYYSQCMTYATNIAKWSAARKYCNSKNWEFKIMTEREIFNP